LAVTVLSVNAIDLWTGSKHVSWQDGGLQIAASGFADAQPGQKMVLHYSDATDGVEFKVMNANFDHLAGSREGQWINGTGVLEQFLTQAAVDSLKLYGLEMIGANFTVTQVELLEGRTLKDGITVWAGFFWVDTWSTLELYRDAYVGIDFENIAAIRFYSEAEGTNYMLNFKESWEETGHFASKTDMIDGDGYAELALTDSLRARLGQAGHWMIQFNKESLSAFNVTDIVLVPMEENGGEETAVDLVTTQGKTIKRIMNGQMVIIRDDKRYNVLGSAL